MTRALSRRIDRPEGQPSRRSNRLRRGPAVETAIAGFALQGALLASGVLTARMLGADGRGYLALLMLFPIALSQLGGLGVPLAVTYELSRSADRTRGVARSLRRLGVLQAVLIVFGNAVVVIAVFGGEPGYVKTAALLTLTVGPAMLAQHYALAFLQGEGRFRAFNLLRLLPFCAYSLAVAVAYMAGGAELEVVTLLWVATYLPAVPLTVVWVRRGRRRRASAAAPSSSPSPSRMVRFGARGLLGWASPVENLRLDQAVVGLFLSPAALGIYVVGQAFSNLPRFLAQNVGTVAYPGVARERDPGAARRKLWRYFWATAGACALVVAVIEAAAGWLVPFFFGQEFSEAVGITRILLIAALLYSARRILTDAARGAGHVAIGTVGEVASWIFLLPAIALLAPLLGTEGVALALVVASGGALLVLLVGVVRGYGGAERLVPEAAAAASPLAPDPAAPLPRRSRSQAN